jgi:exodeoxyribonuclease-1
MPTARLQQLLFLYRGRNFPHTFTDAELQKWQSHRQRVLQHGDYAGRRSIQMYMNLLEGCLHAYSHDEAKLSILRQLSRFAEML